VSWDKYAPFYDWENARTMGRRDLAFWKQFAGARGRGLELGCGTGRLLVPLARGGASLVGIDLSAGMLDRARARSSRLPRHRRPRLLRGDISALPLRSGSMSYVFAPYGVLQSLTSDAAFDSTIAEAARVLTTGGRLGIELVPDLADWETYQKQTRFSGRLGGRRIRLVESVRQDRPRGLTIFDEEFTLGAGAHARVHRFSLTFRTLSMRDVLARLERVGLEIESVQGSYAGGVWTEDADVWIIIARRSVPVPRPSAPDTPRRRRRKRPT
jgi:SAM-dependent methyltransferase